MTDVKRLLEQATPLPWAHGPLFGEVWRLRGNSLFQRVCWTKGARSKAPRVAADADLIVHAVNTLPAYEAAVDALERLCHYTDAASECQPWKDGCDHRPWLREETDLAREALRRLRGDSDV